MTHTIVDVKNLSVQFGDTVVLSNISFSVHERDVIVILGPNGGGKSTLLRAMLGLVPHAGTVQWHTHNISYLPPQESVPRENLPPMTVLDFFHLKEVSQEKIITLLTEVGLSQSLLQQSFSTLSTGQFQRVMLAWVLSDDPSVLVLDEPTAGIDIGGAETVYSLLHRIWKDRNLSIILITHDVSFVWKHATRILCINKDMMCYGSPEEHLTPALLKKLYGTEVSLYEHRHSIRD